MTLETDNKQSAYDFGSFFHKDTSEWQNTTDYESEPQDWLQLGKDDKWRQVDYRSNSPMSVQNSFFSRMKLIPCPSILVGDKCYQHKIDPVMSSPTTLFSSPSLETIMTPVVYLDGYIEAFDSHLLYYQHWRPNFDQMGKSPKGTILVVHDLLSHGSFACLRLLPILLNAGYDLVTFDLRDHGKSRENANSNMFCSQIPGHRIWNNDLHDVIAHTINNLHRSAGNQRNNCIYLYGEGFGASIILDYVHTYASKRQLPLQVKGILACGTQFRTFNVTGLEKAHSANHWKKTSSKGNIFERWLLCRKLLMMIGQMAPSTVSYLKLNPSEWGILPSDSSLLSRDLRVAEALRRDQHRRHYITLKIIVAVHELSNSLLRLRQEPKQLGHASLCIAFFHGKEDLISPPNNILSLANQLRGAQVFLYPKARHYLSQEIFPIRRQFLNDLTNWLQQQELKWNRV
eukprot:jgi/Galph1/4203/GphlegSOOS_G2872.1